MWITLKRSDTSRSLTSVLNPLSSHLISLLMSPSCDWFSEADISTTGHPGPSAVVTDWLLRSSCVVCQLVATETAWFHWASALLKCLWARPWLLATSKWGYCFVAGGQQKRETPWRDKQSITLLLIIISSPDVPMRNTWCNYHWRVFFLSALSQHCGDKREGELGRTFDSAVLLLINSLVS